MKIKYTIGKAIYNFVHYKLKLPMYSKTLHYAAYHNDVNTVKYKYNNDYKAFFELDKYNQTPLDIARKSQNHNAIELLRKYTNKASEKLTQGLNHTTKEQAIGLYPYKEMDITDTDSGFVLSNHNSYENITGLGHYQYKHWSYTPDSAISSFYSGSAGDLAIDHIYESIDDIFGSVTSLGSTTTTYINNIPHTDL